MALAHVTTSKSSGLVERRGHHHRLVKSGAFIDQLFSAWFSGSAVIPVETFLFYSSRWWRHDHFFPTAVFFTSSVFFLSLRPSSFCSLSADSPSLHTFLSLLSSSFFLQCRSPLAGIWSTQWGYHTPRAPDLTSQQRLPLQSLFIFSFSVTSSSFLCPSLSPSHLPPPKLLYLFFFLHVSVLFKANKQIFFCFLSQQFFFKSKMFLLHFSCPFVPPRTKHTQVSLKVSSFSPSGGGSVSTVHPDCDPCLMTTVSHAGKACV